ncbi:hypothetical protein HD806DRAFT_429225 [Xylariaceae sp. AK1471]|nr:hypothetical protein HD806DRAFT_429225 [Xylariaceae sp. AK1471]
MTAPFLSLFLLLLASHIAPALSAAPRFAALDNAAILPLPAAGFAPRWYMEGIPAIPAQPLSPNPRNILGDHETGELDARQDSFLCSAGQHSCAEANAAGFCCDNDRYCYLNEAWEPKCCSLGNKCPDSACDADHLYCNETLTSTITPSGTVTESGQQITSSVVVSYTTSTACCNRACSASSFSCEQTFGGQCCENGFKCGLGSLCIADPPPPTTTSVSTIVPEVPAGCTTSQITCAQTDGGGCCDIGSICTFQSAAPATSTAVCAPNLTLADGGGGSSTALSSGARVGVGVGVALGAAVVIAAATWFCIRRRQRHRKAKSNASAHEMGRNAGGLAAAAGGAGGGGGGGGGGRTGRGQGIRESLMAAGPLTPWTGHSNFSDASGPTISSARPPLHDHGRVYSYFGPNAIEGPFTDRDGDQHDADAAVVTTPPTGPLPSDSTGQFVTAGSMPFHPDHIRRPVEIGGIETQKEIEKEKENGKLIITEETPGQDEDPTTGPFELMGSLGTPSPLNSNDKGPSRPPAETQPKQ